MLLLNSDRGLVLQQDRFSLLLSSPLRFLEKVERKNLKDIKQPLLSISWLGGSVTIWGL
jgi:hypothetical protein